MQRVATELHDALKAHGEVAYDSIVLRSSWRWTHLKTGPFLARALLDIRKRVVQREVDAVLFSSMVSAALAPLLERTLRAHGVVSAAIVHGRDVTLDLAPYQYMVPRIFGALDAVLPVSRATGEACLERELRPSKLVVVPNGVSVHRFASEDGASSARTRLLERFDQDGVVPERGMLLCSVGRQVRRKGFAWFVEHVMPLLPEDVHYWLAGDGPEAQRIEALAEEKGVSHRVRLLGRVSESDLELLYSGADLFVMPNVPVAGDMEGFGVVMLEAGLCGLPSIASNLEGIKDVIEEGENGHLVETGNAWEFSEVIMQYYHDAVALAEARQRASAFVSRHFSWHAVAQQYVEALEVFAPTPVRTPEEVLV